jgi:hypothetical protein
MLGGDRTAYRRVLRDVFPHDLASCIPWEAINPHNTAAQFKTFYRTCSAVCLFPASRLVDAEHVR